MLETIIKTLIFIAAAFAGVIYYKKTKSEKHNVIRVLIAVMLLVIRTDSFYTMIAMILPALLTGLLVLPIPNYHNVTRYIYIP